jgi:hypothetical protein
MQVPRVSPFVECTLDRLAETSNEQQKKKNKQKTPEKSNDKCEDKQNAPL